jgi:hypothetical protein
VLNTLGSMCETFLTSENLSLTPLLLVFESLRVFAITRATRSMARISSYIPSMSYLDMTRCMHFILSCSIYLFIYKLFVCTLVSNFQIFFRMNKKGADFSCSAAVCLFRYPITGHYMSKVFYDPGIRWDYHLKPKVW